MSENLNNVYIRTHIYGSEEEMTDWVLGVIGINSAVEPGPNTHSSSNQLWDLVFCEDRNTFCILSKKYRKVMECEGRKLVLKDRDDSKKKKKVQEWKMDGNYLMMQDRRVMHIKEKALILSERNDKQSPPSCRQFSIISQIFYIKSYQNEINQEIVLDTEGRHPGSSVVPKVRNPSFYSQHWYLEYHLDGTFHIVSNIDRKVMECSEHQLVITDRKLSGGDNQRFKLDGDSITMQDRVLVVVYNNHTWKCVFLEKNMESTSSTQPNQQFSFVRAHIFYIKSYQNVINQEIVLDTEGMHPGDRVVPNVRNPSSYSQLWYLDDHLDGTFHIVFNFDRKVMECSEHQLVITDRSVGDNQRFRWDGDSLITMQDLVLVVNDNYTECVFLERKSTSSTQPNQQFSFVRALYNVYIQTHINAFAETMKDWVLGIGSNLAVEPGPNTQSSNQLWDLVFYEDSKTFCILSNEYGRVMERAEEKLVLKDRDDSKKQLQEWKMDGNYLMMMQDSRVMHIKKNALILSERFDTSGQQFSIISQIFYIKSNQNEINQEIVLDTAGRHPESSVVPNVRNPHSDSQRWYLEYHLDGTFHIVSNIDRKVMECKESGLVITDRNRSGGDNQRFKLDGDSRITTMQDRVLVVAYNNHGKCVSLKRKSTSPTQPNEQFSFVPVVFELPHIH